MLIKQCDSNGYDRKTEHFNDFVDAGHDLRVGLFEILRTVGDLGSVVFRPYMLNTRIAVAADNKTTGKEKVTRLFHNGVAFASQKGFIYLACPILYDAVCADLIPSG